MIVVHGLKNCDPCRKAVKWLKTEGKETRFHDLRAHGLNGDVLDKWIAVAGWETLLNRRGTTWRKLPGSDQGQIDSKKARELMLTHPALIKRPVFDIDGEILVGFKDEQKVILKR